MADGSWPVYTLNQYDLFVAYRFKSITDSKSSDEINKYVSVVWAQVRPEETEPLYSLPVPCADLFDPKETQPQFDDQIAGMQCANKTEILLSDSHSQSASAVNEQQYSWFFIVNTCEALSPITGKADCYPSDESRAVLNDITVETKISSEFFSPKTFLASGEMMSSVFLQESFQLSKSLAMNYKYAVQKVETSFSNRLFYND